MVESEEDYKSKLNSFLKENNDLKSDLKTLSNHFLKKEKEMREMKAENEELTYDKNKLAGQILSLETYKTTLKTELEEKNNMIAFNLHEIQRVEHKMNNKCGSRKSRRLAGLYLENKANFVVVFLGLPILFDQIYTIYILDY